MPIANVQYSLAEKNAKDFIILPEYADKSINTYSIEVSAPPNYTEEELIEGGYLPKGEIVKLAYMSEAPSSTLSAPVQAEVDLVDYTSSKSTFNTMLKLHT